MAERKNEKYGAAQILYFGEVLQLTRYEYGLLKFLIDHPTQVFSRQQLMDQVWEHPDHSLDRTVDTHISRLRKKLELNGEHGWRLAAVYQHGYRLEQA